VEVSEVVRNRFKEVFFDVEVFLGIFQDKKDKEYICILPHDE
jgi:hypothetical protein